MNQPGRAVSRYELVNIPLLVAQYFYLSPDPKVAAQRVNFGTSGHRGSAAQKSFNEAHIFAIAQAVAEYRKKMQITGKLYMGIDTHALSTPACMSALRILVEEGIEVVLARGYTPTPLISFTILEHNKKQEIKSDGIIITPSHNPPEDGGFKYNPPHGGPADTDVTKVIQTRANELLGSCQAAISYEEALGKTKQEDLITPYVEALEEIIDMEAIKQARFKLAADPMGGTAIEVYKKINEYYDLHIEIFHDWVDPTFSFMSADYDGKIRMDCSSPYAMAHLIALKDRFDLAFGNDTDADRHGIVTAEGLMHPNHYLSVAVWYLFTHRRWPKELKVGKTLVSSSMIDRVAESLGVEVYETPVGFKWFSEGLYEGWLGFGGEESAGASFLRKDGSVWTTDKDGIIMALLAAEIKAVTKKELAQIYHEFEERFGKSYYKRVDVPASKEQKELLKNLSPNQIPLATLAGEKIEKIFTKAPGNGAPIGGVKIVTPNGWAAIRPSGTEDLYKIYAESFISQEHLQAIIAQMQQFVQELFRSNG